MMRAQPGARRHMHALTLQHTNDSDESRSSHYRPKEILRLSLGIVVPGALVDMLQRLGNDVNNTSASLPGVRTGPTFGSAVIRMSVWIHSGSLSEHGRSRTCLLLKIHARQRGGIPPQACVRRSRPNPFPATSFLYVPRTASGALVSDLLYPSYLDPRLVPFAVL